MAGARALAAGRRARRAACISAADGTLDDEPPARARDQPPGFDYRYDPADPTPSLGGAVLLSREPVVDNAALEQRDDVLTFTTEPLAEPVEAIGEVSAELWARAAAAALRPVRPDLRGRRRRRLPQRLRRPAQRRARQRADLR